MWMELDRLLWVWPWMNFNYKCSSDPCPRFIPKPWEEKNYSFGISSFQVVLWLAFISDGVGVVVGVARALPTKWKLNIGVVSGVISSTKSEYGIRVRRIRTVSFSSDSVLDSEAYDQWKLNCRSWRQKRKFKPVWFQLDRIAQHSSVTTPTLTLTPTAL